jgi:hypothetical protein
MLAVSLPEHVKAGTAQVRSNGMTVGSGPNPQQIDPVFHRPDQSIVTELSHLG